MAGIDLMTIASLVGHTTDDQIQTRYGHLRKEHKVASAQTFEPLDVPPADDFHSA